MPTEQQKLHLRRGLKLVTLGTIVIGLAGCVVYPDPPPPRTAYYPDGYYSYYDYPSDYRYSDSAYSGDYDSFNANRNADEVNGLGHSDDRNFHDRNDYQQYDR